MSNVRTVRKQEIGTETSRKKTLGFRKQKRNTLIRDIKVLAYYGRRRLCIELSEEASEVTFWVLSGFSPMSEEGI